MKYGVKLTRYGDQIMNMWVHNVDGRFETDDVILASIEVDVYKTKNPRGTYIIEPITD